MVVVSARRRRALFVGAGVVALAAGAVLLASHVFPDSFPAGAHEVLAPVPLVSMVALYLVREITRRAGRAALVRSVMLAVGFLLWAATQRWPRLPQGVLLNDLAIALFITDLFLVIVARSPDVPHRDERGR